MSDEIRSRGPVVLGAAVLLLLAVLPVALLWWTASGDPMSGGAPPPPEVASGVEPGPAVAAAGDGAAPVRVRLVDPQGAPVPDVEVAVRVPLGWGAAGPGARLRDGRSLVPARVVLRQRTGADGVADFGVVPRGDDDRAVEVVVDAAPWMSEARTLYEPPAGEVVFALRRAVTVRGRLVTPDGAPVAGGEVGDRRSGRLVRLADDGRFELALVDADGGVLVVRGPKPGLDEPRWQRVARPRSAAAEQDLGDVVLPPLLRMRGVVTWPDGSPARSAQVTLRALDGYRNRSALRTWTEDDGSFESPPLENVAHRVDVFATLDGPVEGSRYVDGGVVTAVPPGNVRIVLLRSVPELRLTVRHPDGRVVASGEVALPFLAFSVLARIEDGRAVLPLRGDPPWEVRIDVAGHRTQRVAIEAGGVVIEREVVLTAAER